MENKKRGRKINQNSGNQIAIRAAVSQPVVWRWRRGADIRLSHAVAIAKALGIKTIDEVAKFLKSEN